MPYLLALDAGTTSNRAIIFDTHGQQVASAGHPMEQHFPNDGWVEHAPHDIIEGLVQSAKDALERAGLGASDISGVGLTNQRETTVVWDRATSEPVHKAIVWQDRRTESICQTLREGGHEPLFSAKTGLLLDPYFSGTKLRWILDQIPDGQARAERGELAFGTVDSWVAWTFSDGQRHIIDATNASRTLLFNLAEQGWDDELLSILNIPRAVLPEVVDSAGELAPISESIFGHALTLNGIAGDQQAALVGQSCLQPGMVKSTYGTGCFLMVNTGDQVLPSQNRLLSTLAYQINGRATYALEGAIFNVGTTIQWLRDELKLFDDVAETGAMASNARDDQVFLVPAFTGLGAPWWDANARGLICGLTRDTGRNEMVRAALDACGFQTADIIQAMIDDGQSVNSIRVDGGMVVNDWLCQRMADLTQLTIERPAITETTALGAAMLAGLGSQQFDSLESIAQAWQLERRFEPEMEPGVCERLQLGWQKAVKRTQVGD